MNRWAVKYSPASEAKFGNLHKREVRSNWRIGKIYIRVKGTWCYLYPAVNKSEATIDFLLIETRDEISANRFFNKDIGFNSKPVKITIDKSGSNNAALKSINNRLFEENKIKIRQIKYLNNMIEQDHRSIKKITKPTMSLKDFILHMQH